MRRAPLPAVVLLALLAAPAAAPAHSLLLAATPAPGAILTSAPSRLDLRFNNRIEKRLSRVRVVPDGDAAPAVAVTAADGAADRLTATLPALSPGAYRVEWQVLSTDGHVVNGSYPFSVR